MTPSEIQAKDLGAQRDRERRTPPATSSIGKAGAEPPLWLAKTPCRDLDSSALNVQRQAPRSDGLRSPRAPDADQQGEGARRCHPPCLRTSRNSHSKISSKGWNHFDLGTTSRVRPTTGVKLRGPERSEGHVSFNIRVMRRTSTRDGHLFLNAKRMKDTSTIGDVVRLLLLARAATGRDGYNLYRVTG
jgi:hypothetical protein